MVDKMVNALIAAVVGAVAFIAVKALVGSSIYDPGGNSAYNSSNASAGEMMIHDILPLAIAIMLIAGIFMGLTRIKGV